MKLKIAEWNQIVRALDAGAVAEQQNQKAANERGDTAEAKRAYIASENYGALSAKITAEALG